MQKTTLHDDLLELKLICSSSTSLSDSLTRLAEVCVHSIRNGGKIFFCGNGGSASQACHLAAELVGRLEITRKPLPALSLNSDTSLLTCISNDFSFDEIYSRQISALANNRDTLIALSTSGNSPNIINVLKFCHQQGIVSGCFLGKGGGQCINYTDHPVIVNSSNTARIQEIHLLLGHRLCADIENSLLSSSYC